MSLARKIANIQSTQSASNAAKSLSTLGISSSPPKSSGGSSGGQQTSALQSSLNMSYAPNISTPQGMGQTQKDGSIILINKQGQPTGSVINQQGVGSTPAPSNPTSPYYTPPKTSSGGSSSSTPAQPSQSGGFLALKDALNKALDNIFNSKSQTASVIQAVKPPTQPVVNNITASSPSLTASVAPTATAPVQAPQNVNEQYKAVDKTADSATQKSQIDKIKAQEDATKQAQIQNIQSQLAQKRAQLAALEAQAAPEPVLDAMGRPKEYKYDPESNPDISNLSSQIKAMEEEIARVLQDSPELQAATQSLNEKIAEEASIKASYNQGVANVEDQPIAQGFITGQSAALERQANAKLQTNAAQRIPLQMQLANEQAKKQSAIDVAKAKYGFLGDARDRATDIYKTNYARTNTVNDRAVEQANKIAFEKSKTTIQDENLRLGSQKLEASRGADGYVDPNVYLQAFKDWPGTLTEFLSKFPPKNYVNPANTWLPSYLMPNGGGVTA